MHRHLRHFTQPWHSHSVVLFNCYLFHQQSNRLENSLVAWLIHLCLRIFFHTSIHIITLFYKLDIYFLFIIKRKAGAIYLMIFNFNSLLNLRVIIVLQFLSASSFVPCMTSCWIICSILSGSSKLGLWADLAKV